MLASRLRHRVAFERKAKVQNPVTLSMTETWVGAELQDGTPLASVPAEVLTGPGRGEFVAAQAEQFEVAARITVRWFPGLQSDWRIKWDGGIYNIRKMERDISGRQEWRLTCEAGVNDG